MARRAGPDGRTALKLIYNNPAHPWDGGESGGGRWLFAGGLRARFTEQVGEPPIAFLTSWRLALAADLLRSSRVTIAAVARQVGYSTPFALSSAFKRAYGVSPNPTGDIRIPGLAGYQFPWNRYRALGNVGHC